MNEELNSFANSRLLRQNFISVSAMERAHQRIAVLQNQVGDDTTLSFTNYGTPTINGELFYSVALPEKLTSNDWHVHRFALETTVGMGVGVKCMA